ncbi:MAG: sugar transferase, partial [Actinomycetota bacterium]|nr:sugar transferase [Actinomycetota bacterium]
MKAIDHAQVTPSLRGVDKLLTRAATVRTRPGIARLARLAVVAADMAAVVGSMVAVYRLRLVLPVEGAAADGSAYGVVCAVSLPLWPAVFHRYRLYNSRHTASRRDEWGRVLHAVGASVVITAVVAYALDERVARSWLIALFALALPAVGLVRELVRHAFNLLRRRGHCLRPVVIAGTGDEAYSLASTLGEQPELGYRVVGLIGHDDEVDPRLVEFGPVLDGSAKVADQVRIAGAGGVIVATTDVDVQTSNRLTRLLTDGGIHVELSSSLKDIDANRLSVRPLGSFPVVYVEPVKREGWPQVAKRAFDLMLSTLLLVLGAPVLLATAVAIKVTSPGPVLFRQERVGFRGRRFHIYKFRSMFIDADARLVDLTTADGPVPKFDNDPRVTRVGRLIRKLSIDELPQLLNVLK